MTTAAVRMSNIDNGIIALEQQPRQREALARRGEPGDAMFQQITKGHEAPVARQWFPRQSRNYYQDKSLLNRAGFRRSAFEVMNSNDPPEEKQQRILRAGRGRTRTFRPKIQGRRSLESALGGDGGDDGSGQRGQRMGRNDDNGGDDGDDRSGAARGQRREVDRPSGAAPVTRNAAVAPAAPIMAAVARPARPAPSSRRPRSRTSRSRSTSRTSAS